MLKYDKTDTVDDVVEKDMIPLRASLSKCSQFADQKLKTQKTKNLPWQDFVQSEFSSDGPRKYFRQCMISGRCALFIYTFELNAYIPLSCSLFPKSILEHPLYISKPIQSIKIGTFMNKNIPKRKLDRLNHYLYRYYEMGVIKARGPYSMDNTIRTTPNPPDRYCMEKKIEPRISSPGPLGIEFYGQILILYLLIAMIAIAFRALQCFTFISDPLCDHNGNH